MITENGKIEQLQKFVNIHFFELFIASWILGVIFYTIVGFEAIDELCAGMLLVLFIFYVFKTPEWRINKVLLFILFVFLFYLFYSIQIKSNTIKSQAYYLAKMSLYLEGSAGKITFFQSRLLKENDEIDLIAGFRVKTPFSIFSLGSCQFRQRVHTRAFTGVERREKENEKDCVVYLTETGTVYHRSLDCSYLKLTISKVLYRDLVNLRNSSGGKYKICERCCHGITPQDGEEVYITIYGDRYHKSRKCSGLKRTIREIMLSQVGNRAPCSKCGGKEK